MLFMTEQAWKHGPQFWREIEAFHLLKGLSGGFKPR